MGVHQEIGFPGILLLECMVPYLKVEPYFGCSVTQQHRAGVGELFVGLGCPLCLRRGSAASPPHSWAVGVLRSGRPALGSAVRQTGGTLISRCNSGPQWSCGVSAV